jgi:sec-independent protein translocase protein TatB
MPHIGWFEILIIAAISIVVIGPKDFPFVLKKIGSWIGTIKRYVGKVQQEISILDNENIDTDSNNVKNNNKNNNKNNDKK